MMKDYNKNIRVMIVLTFFEAYINFISLGLSLMITILYIFFEFVKVIYLQFFKMLFLSNRK